MIRTIEILLPRLGERRHGLSRKLTGCGERRVAGVGLVQPGLRSGAVGWRERIQFAAAPPCGLRTPAAGTRATTAPRSLPTASARWMRTSFAAPACRRSTRPEPVVEFSGTGGDSFGTKEINSRLRALALGTPEAAKPSSGFSASASAVRDFAAASAAV